MTLFGKYHFHKTTYQPYDPQSSAVFFKIKSLLQKKVKARFEQVGSTAIGIAGKRTIDILVITTKNKFKKTAETLRKLGFQNGRVGKTRKTIHILASFVQHGKKYQFTSTLPPTIWKTLHECSSSEII